MLILLSLAIYLVLGLPVVAWLGHRLAQAHPGACPVRRVPANASARSLVGCPGSGGPHGSASCVSAPRR